MFKYIYNNMADKWEALSEALNMSLNELMELASPENINKPVEQWTNSETSDMTILEAVLHKQLWDFIPFILQQGANVHLPYQDSAEQTILKKVISDDSQTVPPEVLVQLITPQNINHRDVHGATPLYDAVRMKKFHYIPVLIQHGADINMTYNDTTTLHNMMVYGKDELKDLDDTERRELVTQLISDDNIHMVTSGYGDSPLHVAVQRYFTEPVCDNVQLLVDHGASVNMVNNNDNVPLIYCFWHYLADLPVIKMLLPDDPHQMLKAVISLLLCHFNNMDHWFLVLTCLLESLHPVEVLCIELDTNNMFSLNKRMILHHLTNATLEKALNMICPLLEQMCVSRQLTVTLDAKHDGESYVDRIHAMVDTLSSTPPSLTKLAVLCIRQCVLQGTNRGYDQLGLPKQIESLLKLEPLAIELQQIRSSSLLTTTGFPLQALHPTSLNNFICM